MPYVTYRYFSEALLKHTQADILLPDPAKEGPFAVMFLLHGLSDDHTIWMRRTSIERYVADLPLIVVMPDGGRGWYCDALEGFAYETAIGQELPDMIAKTFSTKSPFCITGLSMGGYGALKLALRFPERFHSAVSHSGALHYGHYELSGADRFTEEARRIVGDKPTGGINDLYALVGKTRPSKMPLIRFDCGTEDHLIDSNRSFHAHLTELQVEHEYAEFSGGHTWDYWDAHVQEAIEFHRRHLHF